MSAIFCALVLYLNIVNNNPKKHIVVQYELFIFYSLLISSYSGEPMPHSAKRQMPALPRPRKTRISNVLCLFMRRYIFIVIDHNIFVSKSLQIDGGIHVYVDIKMGVPKYNRKMRVADTVGVA